MINFSNQKNDGYKFHFHNKYSSSTHCLVSPDAKLSEVCIKLLNMGGDGIYVVDFDNDN